MTVPVGNVEGRRRAASHLPAEVAGCPHGTHHPSYPAWSSRAEGDNIPYMAGPPSFSAVLHTSEAPPSRQSLRQRLCRPVKPSGTGFHRSDRWRMFAPKAAVHDVGVEINLVPAHCQSVTQQSSPSNLRVIDPPGARSRWPIGAERVNRVQTMCCICKSYRRKSRSGGLLGRKGISNAEGVNFSSKLN